MEESPAPPLEFILITGAQSPVGAAVAARLAASAPVLLQGAEKAPLMTPAGHVHPGPHLLWPHDLSDVENIAVSLGDMFRQTPIRIKSLVHCVSTGHDPMVQMFAGSVFSAIELIRFLRRREPNAAALSNVVFCPSPAASEAPARAAIEAFMRSAAVELAPKCRVNCVESTSGAALAHGPMDLAATVEFLLSDGASAITGQRLVAHLGGPS